MFGFAQEIIRKSSMFTKTWLVVFFFLLSVSIVSAQIPSQQTQFPFTINGQECGTKEECRVLCQDPVNQAACAELNPNATPKPNRFSDPAFAAAAQEALGCSTAKSCKAVCSLASNFKKCDAFAKQNNLSGGYDKRVLALQQTDDIDSSNANELNDEQVEQLKQIKEELTGSDLTLKEYCQQEEHQAACTLLAKKFGLRGGQKLVGPGGCQSKETCRLYCDDPAHFAECKSFEIPGLNGCTSELACYTELQTNGTNLTFLIVEHSETKGASGDAVNPEELVRMCQTATEGYQGKSINELSEDLSKSEICQILPKTGVPGKNSNCDAYLNSSQPFDQTIFEKICEVKPVVATEELAPVDTQTAASDLTGYSNWCQNLQSVGESEDLTSSDWQVIPSLCQNFVQTFQAARSECQKPEDKRADWLNDPVAYSRYCLSAPKETSDYVEKCKADPANCQSGGFDWYCGQAGNSCVPLYQGRPIDKSVETFAAAGVIKDGDQVSVVLDENTQEFAESVLSDVVAQQGEAANFEVISELPANFSSTAVFISGTGIDQGRGRVIKPVLNTQPIFNRFVSRIPSITISGQSTAIELRPSFAQPWFAVDARQSGTDNLGVTRNPQLSIAPGLTGNTPQGPVTGWGVIRQNEERLKEEAVRIQQPSNPLRQELLPPNSQTIQVNPELFRPQVLHSTERSIPASRPANVKELHLTPLPPMRDTGIPTTGGGTTGSSLPPRIEPTRTPTTNSGTSTQPRFEPTRPPVIEPTKPPTTQSSTSTTTTTQTNTTFTGTATTTTTNPEVRGIETELSFWETLKAEVQKFLKISIF